MSTGKTSKSAASVSFRVADHLRNEDDIAAYLEAVLEDGDPRAMPVALRTVADAMGGLAALAERTGLSRETLYRTLSEKGNPRYDTLTSILGAFGLRVSVAPQRRVRGAHKQSRVA
jgi:probable addiction module antidote protein